MQTLEERQAAEKERHRKSMAIKRAAFKANLDSWREEFESLSSEQLSLLKAYWKRQGTSQHTWSPTDVSKSLDCEATTSQLLHGSYMGAVELSNAIHLENEKIKEKLDQYEHFESLVHRDITHLENAQGGISDSRKFSTEHEELLYYEAVDAATCHDIVRINYPLFWDHHARFIQNETLESQFFFGWNVRRLVKNGHHFHFSKQISSVDSAQLIDFIGDEAWRVFNSPELYERLYTSRVMMHVLQRVDANTSVALQSLPAVDNATCRRCLTLASKIVNVNEEGHLVVTILLLAITPNEGMAKRNAPHIHFAHDTNAYLLLHQREDEFGQKFVEMSFGLHGVYANDTEARFVFLESVCALIRFEQMVLPQSSVPLERCSDSLNERCK